MLLIPSIRRVGEITVYQDDAVWYRFYLAAARPSIRLDKNGRPIFLLTTFTLSEQARAANPSAPAGGGYMNFDVQYAPTEEETNRVRVEMQEWVNQEYQRRNSSRRAVRRNPGSGSGTAPTVELADPLLSGGTVSMHTTQSDQLVTGRFAEAPASLTSGSSAVFNVDLSQMGSAFMKKLMVDDSGGGAIDLSPIQIIYALKMWARLPPVKITVEADSKRVHKTLLKISETNRDDPCTPSEVESYRESGISSSRLKETGDVVVKVDKGDAMVSDDVVESLQDYALDLFDTMIEERFMVPAEEDEDELEFDSDDPDIADRDPGWAAVLYSGRSFSSSSKELNEDAGTLDSMDKKVRSVRVRYGHRVTLYSQQNFGGSSKVISGTTKSIGGNWRSAKIYRPPTSRRKVRKTVNYSTMKLKISMDRSQVVEWPVGGQATLQTFFSGMSKEEIQRHVVSVEESDRTLRVDVRALVPFADSPIQAVEAQLKYEARDEAGDDNEFHRTYTFTEAEPEVELFDPNIINDEQEYSFRYQLTFDDGGKSEYTPWETTTNRALNIAIADPGRLAIEVSAASMNWNIVTSATVRLSHGEGDNEVQQSFELTKIAPVKQLDKRIKDKTATEVLAQVTYVLADDKVVEAEDEMLDATDTLFVLSQPQVDILDVSLMPAGDWDEVAQVVVQLEYEREDGRVYDETYRLKSLDEFVEWAVLLDNADRRRFRYQQLTSYTNGQSETSDWIEAEGDQTILINVAGVPKLKVNILGVLVDYAHTPAAVVSITYGGETQSFTFTQAGTELFSMPLDPSGDRTYVYEITWHSIDGDPIVAGPERSTSTQLLVPKARKDEAGFLNVALRGFAVDFDATPFVDVALSWTDGDREESQNMTLHKDESSLAWRVAIGDRAQRTYSYVVTYNRADGTRVAGASGQTDDPVISITALQE